MKQDFLKVSNVDELARFFGYPYPWLAGILYRTSGPYKYRTFQIPKKRGGSRTIQSPRNRLKQVQRVLSRTLYEIYPGRPSAHGFATGKSTVTNASAHRGKRFVFNLDLEDFFGSVHFGRVRNLFESELFGFDRKVATVLAQICCHDNRLPQGAPTSPVISNIVAWKMDAQLERLAAHSRATYTRYADDMTFSFTCPRASLPQQIVAHEDGNVSPGFELSRIIRSNGFRINQSKVRLQSKYERQEVTGLTVNEFPNVPRDYIRQIRSMLHAWRKHGYDAAEREFLERYDGRHRATENSKSFEDVLRGKLSFLRSVRSTGDTVFNKLAIQFNELVSDTSKQFRVLEPRDAHQQVVDSLWVLTSKNGHVQGTGFLLSNVGLITCAHVLAKGGKFFGDTVAFKADNYRATYRPEVLICDEDRDLAICKLLDANGYPIESPSIDRSTEEVKHKFPLAIYGFPDYYYGQSHSVISAQATSTPYIRSLIERFDVDKLIIGGYSGGPVTDEVGKLVGVAWRGYDLERTTGRNSAISHSQIDILLHRLSGVT